MTKRETVRFLRRSPKLTQTTTIAFVADLHNGDYENVMDTLAQADAIVIGGDLVNRYTDGYDHALRFLRDAGKLAPVFYTTGNHERRLASFDEYWRQVQQCDVTLLDGKFVIFRDIVLGGMASAFPGKPDDAVVRAMVEQPGYKLLICHHPEYFEPYVKPLEFDYHGPFEHGIDLTLSGHAHGGQIRLFNHGVYAPGQGFWPKWTRGFYFHNQLYVSAGMDNPNRLPRFGNPCELTMITFAPWEEEDEEP